MDFMKGKNPIEIQYNSFALDLTDNKFMQSAFFK